MSGNSVDPDETWHSATADLGLHCLHRSVCPNTYGKKGNPGPSCSKLTTSLVNDSLKFTSSDTQIF